MEEKLMLIGLQRMKREGKKTVAAVCYEYQTAQIIDWAGADLVSVGDSLGFRRNKKKR